MVFLKGARSKNCTENQVKYNRKLVFQNSLRKFFDPQAKIRTLDFQQTAAKMCYVVGATVEPGGISAELRVGL